jgi:hypothetical protein
MGLVFLKDYSSGSPFCLLKEAVSGYLFDPYVFALLITLSFLVGTILLYSAGIKGLRIY